MRNHKVFFCEKCNRIFDRRKRLDNHILSGHVRIPWNKGLRFSGFSGRKHSMDSRIMMFISKTGIGWPEESKRKFSERCRGRIVSEETKNKLSALWKERYKTDPIFHERVRRMIKNSRSTMSIRKPNFLEIKLLELLNEILPGQYKFVGNGEIWFGNRNPDFINVNGRKKIIELFGRAVHNPEDELNRIEHYKQFGFDTLVIWANDVKKRIESVKSIVLEFNSNEKGGELHEGGIFGKSVS